ncbi:alpha/beta fold hydrolase [Tabrizicola sp.]|uniref:alpha/beta fold hydrolase n=1 Tax=Tabrizicola sp. TaxID=2005166 RepID=UPI003F402D0B
MLRPHALAAGLMLANGLIAPAHADMTSGSIAVGDKTLAYLEAGTGPAVVIIHGVGGHKEDWQGVATALAADHQVFAIDMLGFGGSSKTGDDLSMPVQADAVKALLDEKGIDRADLVGNSVGGWVATTFAATYPDRIDQLVIIDAAGFKAMFEGTPPVNFDPNDAAEMQKLIDITINSDVAKTPGLAEKAFEAYVASGEKAIAGTWGKSLFASPRLEELFPKVAAPTLVLWGADDKLFPSALAEVFAGQIAGATAQLIPNAGHFPQIDNPDATIAAITAFLN